MAVYAIGDIQGCYKQFKKLVKRTGYKPGNDSLWLCGDLVNRGPQSADVLRYIMDLGDAAHCVLGNHDLNLLAVANDARKLKPTDSLRDVLDAPDAPELLEWLRRRPLLHADKNIKVCMVHAGLHPDWTIKNARKLADELKETLRSKKRFREYLHRMYGNQPERWDNSLRSWERLRFLTNVMTRMRYLDEKMGLELTLSCAPGRQPEGYHPWFTYPSRRKGSWRVVFGHWSTLGLHEHRDVICLDSGCLWGGFLTAVRLDCSKPEYYAVSCGK
jgi:bis(5'-nucleosyl)-tetraphosphatase (symmetrical)